MSWLMRSRRKAKVRASSLLVATAAQCMLANGQLVARHAQAVVLVETDPAAAAAAGTERAAFWSAFCTFNLAVMGR
jgi:hypothetical protein